jgi:hypothetical protein
MRARRLMLVSMVVVGLVAPWSGSANAATHRTVVLRTGIPPKFVLQGQTCGSTDFDDLTQAVHVIGPAKPPLGKGSLAITGNDVHLFVLAGAQHPAGDLTALSFSYDGIVPKGEMGAPVIAEVDLTNPDGSSDSLTIDLPYTGHWATANLLTATTEDSHTSGTTTTDIGATTYAQFATANPSATFDDFFLEAFNCEGSIRDSLSIDGLSYGFNGATTTYDFEPDSALRLTAAAPHTSHKGVPIAITGFFNRGKAPVHDLDLVLQAKPKGSKAWLDTDTVTTRYNGALYSVQLPTVTTSFRWTYPGSSDAGAITSKAITVTIVKPKKKHTKKRHSHR